MYLSLILVDFFVFFGERVFEFVEHMGELGVHGLRVSSCISGRVRGIKPGHFTRLTKLSRTEITQLPEIPIFQSPVPENIHKPSSRTLATNRTTE